MRTHKEKGPSTEAGRDRHRRNLPELLERSAWFPRLSVEAQARVLEAMREDLVPAGGTLARSGQLPQHWYGVIDGLLKWSVETSDGLSITFGGMSIGSWFGEGTLLRALPRESEIVALSESRVAVMPAETFAWLHDHEISFAHFLIQQLNERMHWYMGSYAAHRTLDPERQVMRSLAGLFHPWLHPNGERYLPISQEQMAQLAGISRPRCNRALKQLEEERLIKIVYGGLMVLDFDALLATVR